MMTDDRLKRYLDSSGRVQAWPGKAKNRMLILAYLAQKFKPTQKYTEQEVNLILMQFIDDYVTRRRDLVDYHFLSRTDDGRLYWLTEPAPNGNSE